MWKRNIISSPNETLIFVLRKFWASYILDLAKSVCHEKLLVYLLVYIGT